MSLDTLRWALKAAPKTSRQKMVLISLADRANEELEAYPSTERLELDTLLDLKTVKKCLVELAEQGFIKDTGQRKGKTGRVKVWKLVGVSLRESEVNWKKEKIQKRNDSKNGTIKSDQKRNDSESGSIQTIQERDDLNSNQPKNGLLNESENGTIETTQKRDAEPPIVLTTQLTTQDKLKDICATDSGEPEARSSNSDDQSEIPSNQNSENDSADPLDFSTVEYISAKGRTLRCENLANFEEFWQVFDYKKDKARAADAWLKIPWTKKTQRFAAELNREMLVMIIAGAAIERAQREFKVQAGQTPCYAEKWLSARRWEDEDPDLIAQRLALREEINLEPASTPMQARQRIRDVLRNVMAVDW